MVPPSLGKIVIVEADMYRQKRVFFQPTHFVINTTFRFFFFCFLSVFCLITMYHRYAINHHYINQSIILSLIQKLKRVCVRQRCFTDTQGHRSQILDVICLIIIYHALHRSSNHSINQSIIQSIIHTTACDPSEEDEEYPSERDVSDSHVMALFMSRSSPILCSYEPLMNLRSLT